MPTWTREITTWWRHINKTRFLGSPNLEFHTISWHLNKIWNPKSRTDTNTLIFFTETTFPSFDVAKLVFSPPLDTPNHEEHVDLTTGLFLKKFWVLGVLIQVMLCFGVKMCFYNCWTEVGYEDWQKHITGGLNDIFQTTSRQSDFCPNQKWLCVVTLLIIDLYLWDYSWYMSFILCVVKSRSLICFTCIFHTCIYVFVECFRNLQVNSIVATQLIDRS